MLMGFVRKLFQEVVVPELKQIRAESAEIRSTLLLTNKRLDDIHGQLVDLSRRVDETNRRIDAVREELTQRIDETNRRIDDTNKRLDDTNKRIDTLWGDVIRRIGETNDRLNRLYEVVVRREEHEGLAERVARLERQVGALAARDAA